MLNLHLWILCAECQSIVLFFHREAKLVRILATHCHKIKVRNKLPLDIVPRKACQSE